MFRFFRHIRQKLFLEYRVIKYLGYALGEIVLIVVGILIALQIDNWNDYRKDQIEEKEILGRISDELDLIIFDIGWMLEKPAKRKNMLDRFAGVIQGKPIEDNLSFLEDVANGGAWDQPNLKRHTFEEFHATGKLGLIRNFELRTKITRYYDSIDQWEKRARLRVSDFARIAYEIVPTVVSVDPNGRRTLRDGLSEQQKTDLVELVLNSNLKHQITPNNNLQDFLIIMWTELRASTQELISEINAELGDQTDTQL
jgi:hypothetical protein